MQAKALKARQDVVAKVKAVDRDRDALEGAKTDAEAYIGKRRHRRGIALSFAHHTQAGGAKRGKAGSGGQSESS